ncbi:MAG: ribonuclease R, partial [bacterium]|nr:ribonuclease R [bacterium]
TSRGMGFVGSEKFTEDIMVEAGNLNTALNGDEVEIALHPKRKKERQTGEVIRVLKRAKKRFVGIVKKADGYAFITPDDKRMYVDIFILDSKATETVEGEKALVEIVKWNDPKKNPEGKIIERIGKSGEHETEIRSIVLEKGFDLEYPEAVDREAKNINANEGTISQNELAARKDFRGTLTFTIDPVDAKDFDDALSVRSLPNNKFEIGIHIADVSHYVKEGSALDKEARKRNFSIYLVDRTIPMLPEILSNNLCSLNPKEDKLAFSAVFTMNEDGKILERWFGKTVINSDKRFSYEEAHESLAGKGEYAEELRVLNRLAEKLRQEKFQKGAIDFEQDEIRFELDHDGRPIRILKKQRLDTHKLVEDFMLLANKEVAEFMYTKNRSKNINPFIYRIHDLPDREKIADLATFLRALGHEINVGKDGSIEGADLNLVLKNIEGRAEESLIKTAAIRSMAKAIYSTKNIGHYGLAFKFYTHFTSPIRRYPDLLVHRLLLQFLGGNPVHEKDLSHYQKMAVEASEMEIRVAEAERASIRYKQVEYMKERIGQEFEGVITGVTEWGVYVEEKETKSEGMVRMRDLSDDFYELDGKNYSIVGERSGKRYSLGDKVRFKITSADLDRKTLDLALV